MFEAKSRHTSPTLPALRVAEVYATTYRQPTEEWGRCFLQTKMTSVLKLAGPELCYARHTHGTTLLLLDPPTRKGLGST